MAPASLSPAVVWARELRLFTSDALLDDLLIPADGVALLRETLHR